MKFLSETINNFRNFFKKDMKLVEISLIELIKYPILISDPLLKRDHIPLSFKYNTQIKESDWIIDTISKNNFSHIILNLIKNSVEALVSKQVKNPQITIYLDKVDDNFIINVSDNGGGISENILPRIFEKGYTTKGDNGTGLGMYMSNKILKDHLNGDIVATNNKDGANFIITIPA